MIVEETISVKTGPSFNNVPIMNGTTLPVNPSVGMVFFNIITNKLFIYHGNEWKPVRLQDAHL